MDLWAYKDGSSSKRRDTRSSRGSLLTLFKDEYFISFYIDFHWFNASTMPLLTIYHRLLWILQYCLGETLFLFITDFRAIFRNFHHDPPRVWKTFKMAFSWRWWLKRGVGDSRCRCATHGFPRSEASWRFQELPGYRRLSKENTSNQVKTRRFRAISENIEYSRTPRVREPLHEYFFGIKQRPCRRRKPKSKFRKGVGRPTLLARPTPPSPTSVRDSFSATSSPDYI